MSCFQEDRIFLLLRRDMQHIKVDLDWDTWSAKAISYFSPYDEHLTHFDKHHKGNTEPIFKLIFKNSKNNISKP